MTIKLKRLDWNHFSADSKKTSELIGLLFGADELALSEGACDNEIRVIGHMGSCAKAGCFDEKGPGVAHLYGSEGGFKHLIGVQISDKPGAFKPAAKKIAEALAAGSASSAYLMLPANATGKDVRAVVMALGEAMYRFTRTKPSAKPIALASVTLGVFDPKSLQADFDAALATAQGVALAKELGNMPSNIATPTYLGKQAQELAKKSSKITCVVHGQKAIEKLGMGSFLCVAQGSAQEPKLIELHYSGASKKDRPLVLIGKGITFDTGGISLKPGGSMDEMKFDMCGAASVLGVFEALAALRPRINVVGLIPASENMPSGTAIKPGDVVTSMSGQTIEILNTDAEGRLVLCDALSYAKRFEPTAMIDIATLTGACVVALGSERSGMYANNDELAAQLMLSGDATGDKCWRMPLDEEYAEGLKSNFADMANIAGPGAGSVTAAKFLQKFVEPATPWAHLDIAGTAWRGGAAKGATGRPVSLLMNFILSQIKA
jgi:leucyl aminopeptidase